MNKPKYAMIVNTDENSVYVKNLDKVTAKEVIVGVYLDRQTCAAQSRGYAKHWDMNYIPIKQVV